MGAPDPFVHDPPPVLAARFDVPKLLADPSTLALVSDTGTILWVNLAWHRFARVNGAPEAAQRFGVGASYLDGIAGPLCDDFRARLAACAASGHPLELDYECSTPDRERRFRLRALPLDERAILLSHSLLVEQPMDRPESPPIEDEYVDTNGLVVQCSNCRRVKRARGARWDWVPAWVARPHPRTSHGLCPLCVGFYYADVVE